MRHRAGRRGRRREPVQDGVRPLRAAHCRLSVAWDFRKPSMPDLRIRSRRGRRVRPVLEIQSDAGHAGLWLVSAHP